MIHEYLLHTSEDPARLQRSQFFKGPLCLHHSAVTSSCSSSKCDCDFTDKNRLEACDQPIKNCLDINCLRAYHWSWFGDVLPKTCGGRAVLLVFWSHTGITIWTNIGLESSSKCKVSFFCQSCIEKTLNNFCNFSLLQY